MHVIKTKTLVTNAILLTILIISSFLKVQIFTIPFTMQLLVVILISLLTKTINGFIVLLTYLIMGLIGIPIFANGGGIGYLANPSFGYLLGFLFMPFIINRFRKLLKKLISNPFMNNLISSLIGLLFLYWISINYAIVLFNLLLEENKSLRILIKLQIMPYILIDLLKVLLACYIVSSFKIIFKESNLFT